MTESVRKVFECDHCRKKYMAKAPCLRHETFCSKNPVNHHACFRCVHLVVERNNDNVGYSEKTFTCSKLDKQLHSYKAERIKHSCLGSTERMPLDCADLKTEVDVYFEKQES